MSSVHRIVRARADSTTVHPDRDHVYTFDLEGRPDTWYARGRTYLRALSGDVSERRRVDGLRRHRRLDPAATRVALGRPLDAARRALEREGDPEAVRRLKAIVGWTIDDLLGERQRFADAYRPVSILPPDQSRALVLQATEGCSWNRCTFCSFYRDREFHVKSEAEFRDHVEQVARLLGRGAALRRRLFLGDGNALMLSLDRLLTIFRVARERFPERPFSGFIDLMTGERQTVETWRRLAAEGLERVAVGLESGDPQLLRLLNKPGDPADAVRFVRDLKQAGLALGLIFLVGAGGEAAAERHVERTLELAGRLELDRRDHVYLSPYVAEGSDAEEPFPPWVLRQYERLRDGLRRVQPAATVSRYDIRQFVY